MGTTTHSQGLFRRAVSITALFAGISLVGYLAGCGGGSGSATGDPPVLAAVAHVSKLPEQKAYGRGEPVAISVVVLDEQGEVIPEAAVGLSSDPPADQQVDNLFVFLQDGTYTITATVEGNTVGGLPVAASTEVVIDGVGPAIACATPVDGAVLEQEPGEILFAGSVDNSNGVSALLVNGEAVAVDESGGFNTMLDADWGINFVDISVADDIGNESTRVCAFLLSGTWAPDTQLLSNAVSQRMAQAVFDDGNREDGLDSLADLLHAVLNSAGLGNAVHSALLAMNPLKDSCDQTGILGNCLIHTRIRYLNREFLGPHSSALTLVTNGARSVSTVRNVRNRLRIDGHVLGIPFDTTGWVTYSTNTIDAIYDTGISQGNPRVTLRPGSVSVATGAISTDFSGLSGAVIDITTTFFQGTLRNLVRNLIRDYLLNDFGSVLDGVISGLDVHNIEGAYLARLPGDPATVGVSFSTGFSSVNTSAARMLGGIGTQFRSTPAHARPVPGAPVPSGNRLFTESGQPMLTAVHTGVFNQALFAVWRGGYLDMSLDGGDLAGLVPVGAALEVSASLPPTATLRDDDRLVLSLGAVNYDLGYPALLAEPVSGSLGGRVSCALSLADRELILDDCMTDELFLSTGATALDPQTRLDLETMLTDILNGLLRETLEAALPALPIPGLPLPNSVSTFGLPAGEVLGVVNPALRLSGDHVVVEGAFGLQ